MSETKYLSYCGEPFKPYYDGSPYYLKAILDDTQRILDLHMCTLQGHSIERIAGWEGTIPCKEWQPIQLLPLELQVDEGL